ncbi:MAG: formylglycine-generating enzyme family protein [Cyanobacteria bacterium P01_H01_bin.15]
MSGVPLEESSPVPEMRATASEKLVLVRALRVSSRLKCLIASLSAMTPRMVRLVSLIAQQWTILAISSHNVGDENQTSAMARPNPSATQFRIVKSKRKAQFYPEELAPGVILEMVSIPGGKFLMGYEDEEQHEVTVHNFFISKYPITQVQWRTVANLPNLEPKLEDPEPSHFKGDNLPVEQVSWHDAVVFCERLSQLTGRNYRLPSEAQWEYACRAGKQTPFYFGKTLTTDLANYNGNSTYGGGPKGEYRERTAPVGSFPANGFGLYDMHGNVYEWCADPWHDNYEGAPTDGSAWITGGDEKYRILRGGGWYDDPEDCRSARRVDLRPGLRDDVIGFRVMSEPGRTL